MENKEVNFIEMMVDSAENGAEYVEENGSVFKVFDKVLNFKTATQSFYRKVIVTHLDLVNSRFKRVEKYKEITVVEAIEAIKEYKEVYFDLESRDGIKEKIILKPTNLTTIDWLINTKLYIKE